MTGTIAKAVMTAINEGCDELWRACLPYEQAMPFYQVDDFKLYSVVVDIERMGRGVECGKFAWAGVSYGY